MIVLEGRRGYVRAAPSVPDESPLSRPSAASEVPRTFTAAMISARCQIFVVTRFTR